nr:unnamed protein product [Spirometra erinaceieuropaei]
MDYCRVLGILRDFSLMQAIAIRADETMGTWHSSPDSMVCADTDVEFTKDNQLPKKLSPAPTSSSWLLVEMDCCRVLGILQDFSLMPHLLDERHQMFLKMSAIVLVDLSRDRVLSRRFPTEGLLNGPDGSVSRRREVEFGVGLHLRVAAIVQGGDYGRRLICCRRWAVDVGSVQAVLLGEQVADGGVVATEPFPVLAMCATEGSQGRRLDCVPQLTSSVLHRCVLIVFGGGSGGGGGGDSDDNDDWKFGWPLS